MRCIDADEIKLPQGFFEKVDNVPKFYEWLGTLLTVDAVEVVRCKDCRYYDAENHNCLDEMGYARIWEENDFCSFGERRDNEND